MADYGFPEARIYATRIMPYLASHFMNLQPVPTPGIGTMAVDQWMRCYYDPAVFDKWTLKQCAAVVIHEDLHCFLHHPARAKNYIGSNPSEHELQLWNYAADIVVNQEIRNSQYKERSGMVSPELPPGGLFPEQFKLPPNLSVEEYYVLLEKQFPPTPPNSGGQGKGNSKGQGSQMPSGGLPKPSHESGSASDGQQRPWEHGDPSQNPQSPPGMGQHEQKLLEEHVAREIAEHSERHAGAVSAGLERHAREILKPVVDPVRELMAQVKYAINSINGHGNYTWMKTPRRQLPGGARLPAHIQPVPRVAVIIDTSGSMEEKDLGLALGVIAACVKHLPGVRVITGDTQACHCQKAFRAEQVRLFGGGGTDMAGIIEAAAMEQPTPDVIVCCTDGYTGWPAKELPQRVVACLTQEPEGMPVPSWIRKVVLHARQ